MQAPRAIVITAVALAIAVAAAAGCGGGPPASTCPGNEVPTACPSPAPSFTTDVLPVIQATCQNCHAPGGQEEIIPLVTYDDVRGRITTVIQQLRNCLMPLAGNGNPTITPKQRQTLIAWSTACGAMNDLADAGAMER
jgi:hypothetical protein